MPSDFRCPVGKLYFTLQGVFLLEGCVLLRKRRFARKAVFHSARCVSLGRLCFAPMLRTLSGSPAVLLSPPHLIFIATIHDANNCGDDELQKNNLSIGDDENFILFCPHIGILTLELVSQV